MWTVTMSPHVSKWCSKRNDDDRLTGIMDEVAKVGPADAAAVRAVGSVFDIASTSRDYRYVGRADGNTFALVAVYRHGVRGKEFVTGEHVAAYET